MKKQVRMMTEGIEMTSLWLENVEIFVPSRQIHVMGPDDETTGTDGENGINEGFVTQMGLRVLIGDDFRDDSIAGKIRRKPRWPRNQKRCCQSRGLPPP